MLVADWPDPGLARVAEETGGGYIEIRFGQDLGAAFTGVADELHTQYLLAFTPPKRDGKLHEVSVRVTSWRPEDAGEEELRGPQGVVRAPPASVKATAEAASRDPTSVFQQRNRAPADPSTVPARTSPACARRDSVWFGRR